VIERTAYAVTLNTERRRYYFSDGRASEQLFAAYNKLRANIAEREGLGLLWDRHAQSKDIRYHQLPDRGEALPSSCWCVDIKAAYPTSALLTGLIDEATYRVVMDLPKAERLKCFGMLATRKYIETFRGLTLVGDPELVENPLRKWYLDLCAYVGMAMEEAKDTIGPAGFHLYWVDGIFTQYPYRALGVLRNWGYQCSVDPVDNIRRSADGRYIYYRKGGKETYLCVPQRHRITGLTLRDKMKDG
jgi:hypothetical protein